MRTRRPLRGLLLALIAVPLAWLALRAFERATYHQYTAQEALDTLTTREREVLAHVARGSNRREIAEVLFISPDTVRTHLQRIMAKLDVHSAAELAALAAGLGLSQEEP